ncbi:DUF4199 domain-containing protein [Hymenobacter sp. BRD67]|nr:DUF4199 domain-containing protein [Hymenobacter sp. BRD67]
MQTATPSASTSSVALRYGLLTGLVSIIYLFVTFATGQESNQPVSWLSLVIPITGVYLAHKAFKQLNGGFMSYGQGVGIGVLLSVVSGALTSVFNYVYRTIIDPDITTRTVEAARAKMEAAGTMSDAQIDQAMAMASKFSSGPIMLIIGLVVSVLFGLLISLVIAAITKNPKPEFE